ncbi:MAG: Ezrin/radixin/moesin family protein [Bacteroidota bacterium]
MKTRIFTLLIFSALLAYSNTSVAQLSKAEKKKWKNEAKKYKSNPALLKDLVEENQSLKTQVSSFNSKISALESKVSEKDSEIDDLQTVANNLKAEVASAKRKVKEMTEAPPRPKAGPNDNYEEGVVFKVQVGAFKNADEEISNYAQGQDNFNEDTDGEIKKYTIGTFRDYWEADGFKKYLRQMGVKEAWIVSYKDGQRVPIKEVLEGII